MAAKLIRSTYNITAKQQGGVVTIGNFDGVHQGHQYLLKKVKERAQALHLPSLAITFEPHPFEYFGGNQLRIPRLTRMREKFTAIASQSIDNILILPFNQTLANKSASDFVSEILVGALKIQHIIIGDDFHFGHKRQGDFSLLNQAGLHYGFSAEAVAPFLIDGERVSSTRVRKALADADHSLVKRLLGHAYTMQGRVRYGTQLGRQLGFPTLNIYLHRQLTPVNGVYTVYVHGLHEKPLPGAANIGTRPTVDGTRCLLEVHLLDFNEDVYGRYVTIEFCKKLHEERHYPSLEILKENIAKDVDEARSYFKQQGRL
jgi:riboflavin kinase / FMN adenylyltransferase